MWACWGYRLNRSSPEPVQGTVGPKATTLNLNEVYSYTLNINRIFI